MLSRFVRFVSFQWLIGGGGGEGIWSFLALILVIEPVCPQLKFSYTIPTRKSTTGEADAHMFRFTTKTRTPRRIKHTTELISFEENCDYLGIHCMEVYNTGSVCGRTVSFEYMTFENYCMLDYVNCMERYEEWEAAHMGECFDVKVLSDYNAYPYKDDSFLDGIFLVDEV